MRIIAPPWNGARSAPPAAIAFAVAVEHPLLDEPMPGEPAVPASSEGESVSAVEVRALEDAGVIRAAPTFDITVGKTYSNQGFFNVPVKFSDLFPEHGTQISIYCGNPRSLIRATVDLRTN